MLNTDSRGSMLCVLIFSGFPEPQGSGGMGRKGLPTLTQEGHGSISDPVDVNDTCTNLQSLAEK